jgi:pimeloyl-ACP methyl ester carboxylesterase
MRMSAAIAIAFAMWAESGASGDATARLLSVAPCTFEAQGEKIEAECGRIAVPETHYAPTEAEIELPFVRFRSTSPNPRAPIVYLAGGPGGSGIGTAKSQRFHLFMKLREAGDVIVFDQRGTGGAKPDLSYNESWGVPMDQPADFDAWTPYVEKAFAKCAEHFRQQGVNLAHYNTKESAADVDSLRRVLDLEKISLWGTSYGTHLAFAVIRYHGGGLDRVIVSGPEGPDHTLKLPSSVQIALENIAAEIAKRPEMSAKIPDFMDLVRRNLDRLERQPALVQFRGQDIVIGRLDLAMFIAESVGRRRTISPLPRTLLDIDAGDYRRFAPVAYTVRTGSIGSAMSVATDCASGASPEWLARIFREDKTTLVGNAQNFPFDRACSALGVPDLGEEFRGRLTSEVPILFIAGTFDARTPIRNAEELRPGSAHSYQIIVENAGHDEELFSLAPGLGDRMVTFLRGGAPSEDRIVYDELEFAPLP